MEYQRQKEFLICIDSDGCAFNNMEIKWKECFIPALIKCFSLQPISSLVRAKAERINLYASTRGVNRFLGTVLLFDQLANCEEVKRYRFTLPDYSALAAWCERETELSNQNLQQEIERTGNDFLTKTLAWSNESNRAISDMVHNLPPFPFVKESVAKAKERADIAVVSSANREAVLKEWGDHGMLDYTNIVCTQDMGSKKQCIEALVSHGYPHKQVMMLGDSLLDLKAAKENDVLFYPIIAGKEDACWQEFYNTVLDLLFAGGYTGAVQQTYVEQFEAVLC